MIDKLDIYVRCRTCPSCTGAPRDDDTSSTVLIIYPCTCSAALAPSSLLYPIRRIGSHVIRRSFCRCTASRSPVRAGTDRDLILTVRRVISVAWEPLLTCSLAGPLHVIKARARFIQRMGRLVVRSRYLRIFLLSFFMHPFVLVVTW